MFCDLRKKLFDYIDYFDLRKSRDLLFMENFRLKVFQSVAKNLSFTRAASELFITQPAVTKHIQALEGYYGIRLFIRKGGKIVLTTEGKTMLDYVNKVVKLEQNLEEELSKFKREESGLLRLGASTTIAQYIIPGILSGFNKKYPTLKLSLLNGNSEQIAKALHNDEIDLGIVEGKLKNKDIHYELFMADELVVTSGFKNDFVKKSEVTLKELISLPFVMRERGSGTLEVLEYAFKEKKIKLSDINILMYLGSTEAIKKFIESGSSVGFLSVKSIEKELKAKTLKTIKVRGFKIKRTFNFISLHGNTPKGLPAKFMKYAKQYHNQK